MPQTLAQMPRCAQMCGSHTCHICWPITVTWLPLALLCSFEGREGAAVLLLTRRPFEADQLPQLLASCSQADSTFQNDIYSQVKLVMLGADTRGCWRLKHPADSWQHQRCSRQDRLALCQTP